METLIKSAEALLVCSGIKQLSDSDIAEWNSSRNDGGMPQGEIILNGWVRGEGGEGTLEKEFYAYSDDPDDIGVYRKAVVYYDDNGIYDFFVMDYDYNEIKA